MRAGLEVQRMPCEQVRSIAVLGRRHRRRRFRRILGWLAVVLLMGCVASQTGEPTALRPAPDRLLTAGDTHIVEEHL